MFSHNSLAAESLDRTKTRHWLFPASAILALLVGIAIAYLVGNTGFLSILIVLITVLVLIAVLYPELALFGLLLVVYVNLSDVLINYHGLPSIAKPVVGIVFGIILIRATAFKDRFYGWKSYVLLTILYGLIGVLPMLIEADYEGLSASAQDYLKDVFIGLEVVLLLRTPRNLRQAVWLLLFAGLLMGSLTFYQQVTNTLEDPYWGFGITRPDTTYGLRIAGPMWDPNTYAQIMAVLIPLALERFLNERKPLLRLLALLVLFLCGFAAVYTYSRGGFLAVIACLLYLFIRRPPRPALTAGLVGLLLIVFQLLPKPYVERISTLFYFLPSSQESALQDRAFRGRSSENLVATMMFKDHLLIGVGAGNFNANYQDYSRKLGIDPRRDERSAHSLYLEVASERGLLGLAAFFIIISFAYWSLWQAEKTYLLLGMQSYADMTVALAGGLTAYLTAALFLHDSYIRYFFVLIGIAWAAASIARQAQRSARQLGAT
jgi:O-antigen ligase